MSNSELALYKHDSTFYFLPSISYTWAHSEHLNKTVHTVMFSFLYWTLDVQVEVSHNKL